ncbi:MAG: superoxide dismutase [Deltaproteobacteria bacterium]|nr:superoxide dismutase [Deltaproteobacteria bacterium]
MSFTQPKLPYELKALAPYLSEEQMSYHYGKHHAAYFNKLNTLVDGKPEAEKSIEDLIKTATGPIFNNAAQAWNHTFFWNCMTPAHTTKPSAKLLSAIESSFGTYDAFKEQFSNAAINLFGSGWAWLAKDGNGKLEIIGLSNADTPMKQGKTALLTLDVWEHAYYVDYRNERPRFVQGFWDVVNWDFVEKCF